MATELRWLIFFFLRSQIISFNILTQLPQPVTEWCKKNVKFLEAHVYYLLHYIICTSLLIWREIGVYPLPGPSLVVSSSEEAIA